MSSDPGNTGTTGGLDKETRRRMTIALCDQPVITQLVETGLASKLKREENKRRTRPCLVLESLILRYLDAMDFDDIVYDRNQATIHAWQKHMQSIGSGILKLASKYCHGQPCYAVGIRGGAFNYCIEVSFDQDEGVEAHWLMRFPIPGAVMHPEAKVRHEVAVMRYLYENTTIPVPRVVAWGTAEDNIFEGVGPFIIMEFVQGKSLYEVLKGTPIKEVFRPLSADEYLKELQRKAEAGEGDNEVLSPLIDDKILALVYRQLAIVYLELSEHSFDKIGSLDMTGGLQPTWTVTAPPYTNLANEMERVAGVSKEARREPFDSAADYLLNVAQQKINAMQMQRNSVDDVEFGREAYAARHLFRDTVPTFLDHENNHGPFKLVCDDFRPGNILVDRNLKITAICDWEWTYAAPYQQFYTAPRWLLLKAPEEWRIDEPYGGGVGEDDMRKAYEKKLDLFLRILKEEEVIYAANKLSFPAIPSKRTKSPKPTSTAPPTWFHDLLYDDTTPTEELDSHVSADKPYTPVHTPAGFNEPKSEALSSLMRKSWTTGQFWFNECLRAYNFDLIYWLRFHDLCYGPRESVECCVKDWAAIKSNRHIEDFIEEKLRDLKAYQKELKRLEETPASNVEDGTNGRGEHNDGKENKRPQMGIHEAAVEQDQEVVAATVEMGKATLGNG
ncbi:MAG: hypothetical protein Q9195_009310 [Heterodermia aff. obscurata]